MEKESLVLFAKVVCLVVFALIIMIAVYIAGGQSILPWIFFFVTVVLGILGIVRGQNNLDLSVDVNRKVESNHVTQPVASKITNTMDWSKNAEVNLEKVNNSPEWRRVQENNYSLWRKIGSLINRTSNLIQSKYVSEYYIKIAQISVVIYGCSWFLIILIELMDSGGFSPIGFSAIAEISPFSYSMSNLPVLQIVLSLTLFAFPIAYQDWKVGTTCDECNSPFSLRSKGKYWHPDLKERTKKEGTWVTTYHGVRFRECQNCRVLYQNTNYSWKESN